MNKHSEDMDVAVDADVNRLPEPRLPELADYSEEDLNAPTVPLQADLDVAPVGVPVPQHTLNVDVRNKLLTIDREGEELVRSSLSLDNIWALFHPSERDVFTEGIKLRIPKRDLISPLGYEALLQTILINTVFSVFPRRCRSYPLRKRLQMLSLNAEVNHIRNSAHINSLNHSYVLKDCVASKPLLMALPGPSMDLEYIKKHRDSFVLLAVGRAATKLIEAGIEPDFAYIQDVNALAWDTNFEFLGDRQVSTTLIANPAGRIWKYRRNFKRVFKAWNLFHFENDVFPRLEEIGPSSISGGYSVARLLGGDPIVIIGSDCGANMPEPEADTIPESFTNIDYEEVGDDLVFSVTRPYWGMTLNLHYPGAFSIASQTDYVAGAQWLKIKATQDMAQYGLKVYDNASTRLCRFNTPILDSDDYTPGPALSLPELPSYRTEYDIGKYLRQKKSGYSFIKRQLDKGILPDAAWRFPQSCVLTNTTIHQSDNMETRPIDVQIAKDNTEFILQHIDIAFEELAAGKG